MTEIEDRTWSIKNGLQPGIMKTYPQISSRIQFFLFQVTLASTVLYSLHIIRTAQLFSSNIITQNQGNTTYFLPQIFQTFVNSAPFFYRYIIYLICKLHK